jgi:hypothetical protein
MALTTVVSALAVVPYTVNAQMPIANKDTLPNLESLTDYYDAPTDELNYVGFRLAEIAPVPEPSTGLRGVPDYYSRWSDGTSNVADDLGHQMLGDVAADESGRSRQCDLHGRFLELCVV